MRKPTQRRNALSAALRLSALSALSLLAAPVACGNLPIEADAFPPQGTLTGTLVYSGPPPCVQGNHVLGAALLLVFNEDLLPPPEGFGTSASQLGVVAGDVLFQAITEQLPGNSDPNKVVCPAADAPNVTVSAPWTIGPLPAGRWQVRAFFDRDGDFSPILKIHQLPTAGDVGGGAIANVTEVLAGKPVRYQTIEIGSKQGSQWVMPETGAHVDGISITIGQVLPLSRPIFYYQGVKDERPTSVMGMSGTVEAPPVTLNTDPSHIVLPQDERFLQSPTVALATADKQFIRVEFGAGMPEGEAQIAAERPYVLQTIEPFNKFAIFPDVDANGVIKGTPEKAPVKIASLFPQAIFARLDPSDTRNQTAQASPAVILQGLTLNEGSALTTNEAVFLENGKVKPPRAVDKVTVALRPSVICLNPLDLEAPVYVVTPSFTALDGGVVIDPVDIEPKVRAQLGNRPNIKIIQGCLPKGQYQANLVYNTGQAWTVPNEAGPCLPVETAVGSDSCRVGDNSRRILASQEVTLEISGEREAGWCKQTFTGPDFIDGVPKYCLRTDEGGQAATSTTSSTP